MIRPPSGGKPGKFVARPPGSWQGLGSAGGKPAPKKGGGRPRPVGKPRSPSGMTQPGFPVRGNSGLKTGRSSRRPRGMM